MILLVDMGNTRIKWRVSENTHLVACGAIATDGHFSALDEELGQYAFAIQQVYVASVLSQDLEDRFSYWCRNFFNLQAYFVRSQALAGGVHNGYENPSSLGVDRWLALLASFNRTKKACVVASFGTAVTVDLLASTGEHLGGYIAPGMSLIPGSLNKGTQLISVDLAATFLSLHPGRNTQAAVYGAMTAALVGVVNNALTQLRQLEPSGDVSLLISGGDGQKILPLFPEAQFIPDLVLDGLCDFAWQTLK